MNDVSSALLKKCHTLKNEISSLIDEIYNGKHDKSLSVVRQKLAEKIDNFKFNFNMIDAKKGGEPQVEALKLFANTIGVEVNQAVKNRNNNVRNELMNDSEMNVGC